MAVPLVTVVRILTAASATVVDTETPAYRLTAVRTFPLVTEIPSATAYPVTLVTKVKSVTTLAVYYRFRW